MFHGNLKLINDHNSEAELGLHTYTLGINQFADLTNDEWRQKLGLGVKNENTDRPRENSNKINSNYNKVIKRVLLNGLDGL